MESPHSGSTGLELALSVPGFSQGRLKSMGMEERWWPLCPRGGEGVCFLAGLWGHGPEEAGGILLQHK